MKTDVQLFVKKKKNKTIADLCRNENKNLLANTVAVLSINYHIQILVFTKSSTNIVLTKTSPCRKQNRL